MGKTLLPAGIATGLYAGAYQGSDVRGKRVGGIQLLADMLASEGLADDGELPMAGVHTVHACAGLEGANQAIDALETLLFVWLTLRLSGGSTQHDPLMRGALPAIQQAIDIVVADLAAEIDTWQVPFQSAAQILQGFVQVGAVSIRCHAEIEIYSGGAAIKQIHHANGNVWVEAGIHVGQGLAIGVVAFFINLIKADQACSRGAYGLRCKVQWGRLQKRKERIACLP